MAQMLFVPICPAIRTEPSEQTLYCDAQLCEAKQ